ncbi:O-methyltransferase [Burkholderia stagnalis]
MIQALPQSLLDPAALAVVNRLHGLAKKQFGSLIRHYLPRLPGLLWGQSIWSAKDIHFFDDKLLPLDAAQGELLYMLARAGNARCIVEFGTSFGVSTIYLAAAMRDAGLDGKVIGTELVPRKAASARANLDAAGLGGYVEIREGDARETLCNLDRPVDLLLLDGWPMLAMEILQIVEPNLTDGALVVVDNVAHFPTELRPVVEKLSQPPYRATRLPLKSGTTLVGVHGRV